MLRERLIPPEIDERLSEWASYFRDRRPFQPMGSAEKHYKRHSDDLSDELGVGVDQEAPKPPRPRNWVLRAMATEDAIKQLPLIQRWVLTYAFCYPTLPRFVILKSIKHFTGQKLNWRQFLDQLDIGRMRLYTLIK